MYRQSNCEMNNNFILVVDIQNDVLFYKENICDIHYLTKFKDTILLKDV